MITFDGIINEIERRYREYRRQGVSNNWMEEWLKKVMVERTCLASKGTRLKRARLQVTFGGTAKTRANGKTIFELGEMTLAELREFLTTLPPLQRQRTASSKPATYIGVSAAVRRSG